MRQQLAVGLLAAIFSLSVLADKPEWAGEGKPSVEQRDVHKGAMKSKGQSEFEGEYDDGLKQEKEKKIKKERKEKKIKEHQDDGDLKGLEKQSVKKAEQERKELGKGSEVGQESREESKKWWKFWE